MKQFANEAICPPVILNEGKLREEKNLTLKTAEKKNETN